MATQREAVASRSPYFVNLPVDFFFIGGASILAYLLIRGFHQGGRTDTVISLGIWLSWVVNWPHFSATSYRLYGSRDNLRQYPVTAVAAPLIVLAGVTGAFLSPLVVAPFFVKIFLLWSPYHFSGQSIGVSLLYARRGGHRVEKAERFFLASFIYGTFLTTTLRAEAYTSGAEYNGVHYPGFGVPEWASTVVGIWTHACALMLLLMLARQALQTRKLPPLMYLLPGASQYVWFMLGGAEPGFNEFVPFFHSLQYLTIAWAMQLKERADQDGAAATPAYVATESLRWYALNIIGGVALFWAIPQAAAHLGIPTGRATAILIAAAQLHHFFVDGVIWKLKSKSVVSPLLVNVPELIRQARPAPEPTGALT